MPDVDALTFLTLGVLLGARHALDADHLAAVTAILSREPCLKTSGLIGLAWGVGHTLTVVGVGLVLIAFEVTVPPPLARAVEFAVGLMLVGLGLSLAVRMIRDGWHAHEHVHGGTRHWHAHRHRETTDHEHDHWMRLSARPLLVGMCHGLAGTATLALLVASAVSSFGGAALYMVAFGLGSVLGMILIAMVVSLALVMSAGLGRQAQTALQGLAGLGSIGLGLFIMAGTWLNIRPF